VTEKPRLHVLEPQRLGEQRVVERIPEARAAAKAAQEAVGARG